MLARNGQSSILTQSFIFYLPNLRNPMSLWSNISQVFPVDLHTLISHVQLDSRLLLLLSQARRKPPTVSKPSAGLALSLGSAVCVCFHATACQPRRRWEKEGDGGRVAGVVSCAWPLTSGSQTDGVWWVCAHVSCPQVAAGGAGGVEGDVRWADDDALFSLRSPVLIFLIPPPRQCGFFSNFPNKLGHIRPKLN